MEKPDKIKSLKAHTESSIRGEKRREINNWITHARNTEILLR